MHRLYDYAPSLNCWKIRELFRRLKQPLELIPVSIFTGEGQKPEFLKMNPTGAVPVMVMPDGSTVAESNAILVVCGEGTKLMPTEAASRGKVLQWLFFEQNYLEPSLGALQHWVRTGKIARRDPVLVTFQRDRAMGALSALDRGLGNRAFVAGELSIADIALYAYGHLADAAGLDTTSLRNYRAWLRRFSESDGPLAETYPYSIDPASSEELPTP
ncbi:MAG: glutathione S-transferase family protein [Rhizobiales bacterium]|nr:glutathione S-transferase family protein [Hyphomicrobiales bacterium]